MLGHWKNFEELEENLSLPELEAILEAGRDAEYQRFKFQASLKGINLDEETNQGSSFDDIKRRADAKLYGISEEEVQLREVGIGFQVEEEGD